MMAEYERDITDINNGGIGKTTPLLIDTCGGYPINLYLIQCGRRTFLRLDDAVSEHLLDLDQQVTYVVTRSEGLPYVGELVDDQMSMGWSMTNVDPSTLKVTIGGKAALRMVDLTKGTEKVYIGCLTGGLDHLRFAPADELPERPINYLHR